MMTSEYTAAAPRHTLTTVLAIVGVVGLLSSILFPTLVGPIKEGDIPADCDLDSRPAARQVMPRAHSAHRFTHLAAAHAPSEFVG